MGGGGPDYALNRPSARSRATIRSRAWTGQSSYAVGRAVDVHLVGGLPNARHLVVPGGHLIDAAHPEVLSFLSSVLTGQASVDAGA